MKDLRNKVAAVTGAASGIGRCLALNLAAEGCNLALSDINEDELKKTQQMLKDKDIKVGTTKLDVASREQVHEWADSVVEEFGQVDIIINNAGVVVSDMLEDISYENFEWAFNIDFWGVVYGTKAFLPHLRQRPEGNIVNISSINGIIPFPYNGPYNCAKFAVKAFNETLVQEIGKSNIHITSVHPGGIKTNIANNMRFVKHYNEDTEKEEMADMVDKTFKTSPEKCAEKIVGAIKNNKKRLLVGIDAKFMDLAARLLPVTTYKLTGTIYKKVTE